MAYRDTRGWRRIYAALGGFAAVVGSAAILYYGVSVLFFSNTYPNLPDTPLPPPPGGWGASGAGFPPGVSLSNVWTPPGQAGQPVSVGDLSAFYLARFTWVRDAWHPISRDELLAADRQLAELAVQDEAQMSSQASAFRGGEGRMADWSLVEQARQLVEESQAFTPAAALFAGSSPYRETTLFGAADMAQAEESESGAGLLMRQPFARRLGMFPYTPETDQMADSAMAAAPYGGVESWLPASRGFRFPALWPSQNLASFRYRTYVSEAEGFGSPFQDPFGTDLAGPVQDLLGTGLGADDSPFVRGTGSTEMLDPWLDNPIYDVPR
jgi:hypothetical protein